MTHALGFGSRKLAQFHVKRRKAPEGAFQAALVRDLRAVLTPATFMTHFPAGGGGPIRGALLKLRGLVPGVPDLLFIHNGQAFWMELKPSKRRKESSNQIVCHAALKAAGSDVVTVRNLDEALTALMVWKIPLRMRQAA